MIDNTITAEELARLCDVLRAKGVRVFTNSSGGIHLEFGPPTEDSKPAAAGPDPDVCRCGHPNYAHTNGACLSGCNPENCVEPDTV